MLLLPRHRRLVIVKSISSKSQIMVFPDWVRQRTTELEVCVIFLTRMPLAMPMTIVKGDVSRALWAATVLYSIAVTAAFTLSAAAPLRTGAHTTVGELLICGLAASWLGGTVHGFLVRRRVFS